MIPRLEDFYRLSWFSEGRLARLDIVYAGNARGGYTRVSPGVHSVIDVADATYQGWLGVEMMLHGVSHGMTDPLTEALDKTLRAAKKGEGILWHAVQFCVVDEFVKRTLDEDGIAFKSYLYETGLFDRVWPQYKPHIEAIMADWVDGELEWSDAIRKPVGAI